MLEILSRIQFALTVSYHFLFVPLTIGLILLIAIFEWKHYRNKNDHYRKLADYFGNIFVVNYAIGVVTGIAMSLQFGTNWGSYSEYMGDIFGAPLALEALIAFFLESTFTGIFVFRRHKMSAKFRFLTVALILLGTTISALWIITANAFMQNPVGYIESADKTKLILNNFWEVLTNPYAWYMLIHTLTSAYLLGAFFVLSVSSYKLLKLDPEDENREIFRLGMKISAYTGLVMSLLMPIIGSEYFKFLLNAQPTKVEAIVGNSFIVQISFIIMVTLGVFFIAILLYTVIYFNKIMDSDVFKKIYVWSFILPYIAIISGWFVAEFGRQPWIVYGLMKVSDGLSDVPVAQVAFSIISITLLYAVLLYIIIKLSWVQVKKSPNEISYLQQGGNDE